MIIRVYEYIDLIDTYCSSDEFLDKLYEEVDFQPIDGTITIQSWPNSDAFLKDIFAYIEKECRIELTTSETIEVQQYWEQYYKKIWWAIQGILTKRYIAEHYE